MAGPILIFGRFISTPSLKKVWPVINLFGVKIGNPVRLTTSALSRLSYGDAFSVICVNSVANSVAFSKIFNSIVSSVSIYVIDYCGRLLSVMQKPSNSVRKIISTIKSNNSVSGFFCDASSNITFFDLPCGLSKPPKVTRVRAIAQHFANFLWNNLASQHDTSSIVLVRGLTAATVSTPIIPRSVGYANG